jgi:hypothetical protein
MRRTSLRVFDAFLFGILLSAAIGLPSIIWEAHGSSVGSLLATAYTSPGAALMKPFHYGAFDAFKHITHSDGPGAAYLQMLLFSHFVWTLVLGVAFYICVRHFYRRRLSHS